MCANSLGRSKDLNEIQGGHVDANIIHLENASNPLGNNNSVYKTLKIHFVFNGTNENPCTRSTKSGHDNKRQRWQAHRLACMLQILFCQLNENPPARVTRRGPSRSTMITIL